MWAKCKNKTNICHLAPFYRSTVVTKKSDFFLCIRTTPLLFHRQCWRKGFVITWKIDKQALIFYFLVGRTIWAFTTKATFWLANIAVIWRTIWQWWLLGITQSLISTRKTLRKERVDSYCISVSYLEMVSAVKGQDRNISICLGHNREEKCDVTLPWWH